MLGARKREEQENGINMDGQDIQDKKRILSVGLLMQPMDTFWEESVGV